MNILVGLLKKIKFKWILYAVIFFVVMSFMSSVNPFARNESGYRTFVQTVTGNEWIRFKPGIYYKGFFSKTTAYPDVITVMFSKTAPEGSYSITSLNDPINIRFNDATRAEAEATVRWRLPKDETSMVHIHKEYRNSTKLAETTLKLYTIECLKYSAQIMESETHYSGGMSKLSEDFQDQLENGQFILEYKTEYVTDTFKNTQERLTITYIRKDENGKILRNKSDVQQFNIEVAYASVTDVDYESLVDKKLQQKIDASTRESISKQNLITAKQEALTAEEEGKRRLIEIEYEEKQIQTQQVIERQTAVMLATEDIGKERAALEAAKLKAQATKVIADAEAYAKKKVMDADGALEKKLDAYKWAVERNAQAIENSKQPLVPKIVIGGDGKGVNGGSVNNLLQMMMVNEARNLGLDTKIK